MGNSVRAVDLKSGTSKPATFYGSFRSDEQAELAPRHPADLKAPSESQFDMLERHGFEIADATLTTDACRPIFRSRRRGETTREKHPHTLPRISSWLFRLVVLLPRWRTLHDDRRPTHRGQPAPGRDRDGDLRR
jgi:hypothetical protein